MLKICLTPGYSNIGGNETAAELTRTGDTEIGLQDIQTGIEFL